MSARNYRECPKCKKLSHFKSGEICPHCNFNIENPPKPKLAQIPSTFPVQHVNRTIRIDYNDTDGTNTERTIDARTIYRKNGNTYITGHCHLRRDSRTFREDRIGEAIDPTTGEVIDDIALYLLPDGAVGVKKESSFVPILQAVSSFFLVLKAVSQLIIVGFLSYMLYSCFWAGGG